MKFKKGKCKKVILTSKVQIKFMVKEQQFSSWNDRWPFE